MPHKEFISRKERFILRLQTFKALERLQLRVYSSSFLKAGALPFFDMLSLRIKRTSISQSFVYQILLQKLKQMHKSYAIYNLFLISRHSQFILLFCIQIDEGVMCTRFTLSLLTIKACVGLLEHHVEVVET